MTFDVIIVGGGGSGLSAAVSAAEHGCSVVLLEKQPQLGGTTGIAVGSFTANSTAFQTRAGIEDNPSDHAVDAGKFAAPEIEACNNGELRRFLLENASDTLDWLAGMGLSFHGPSPEPPNRVPRMHNVVPGAKAYIAALQSHLLRLGGTILCNADARELIQSEKGVTGVEALVDNSPTTLTAKRGVILAAGDYTNSPELIGRFKGDRFTSVEGINPHSTGDGHRLAEKAGAKLLNMDITYGPELRFIPPPGRTFQQVLPTHGFLAKLMGVLLPLVPGFVLQAMIRRLLVTWQHPEDSLFDDGAILINSRGERFCDETRDTEREIAIAEQPDKRAYILLDERLIQHYSEWPHFISTAPRIAYAYVEDYLRLRPDVAVAGDRLDELARMRGIPTDTLIRTVDTFNSGDRNGRPSLEGKRWCLLGPAKAYFTTTEGGAAIDQAFRVLDETGNPIPGLYAVGQNGLGGQILWGHGLHIAWAMTSGRLCGAQLARD
ncbi:MAG: FAD-dependent oxidoreductase [Planctomycetota bacterium]|jgi:fumarate reductase flavoprotein subunit|nr:FAD-dependent oxidoreductase [Planctomycetota bacterium]